MLVVVADGQCGKCEKVSCIIWCLHGASPKMHLHMNIKLLLKSIYSPHILSLLHLIDRATRRHAIFLGHRQLRQRKENKKGKTLTHWVSSSSCLLFIRFAFFTLTSPVTCQITVHHTTATTKLNCSPAFHLTCQLVDLHYWQKRRKRRRVFVFFVQHPAERIFANTKNLLKKKSK